MKPFDVTDVEADLERVRKLETNARNARTFASRAFAQGFTAALEDGNSADWVHYYGERGE